MCLCTKWNKCQLIFKFNNFKIFVFLRDDPDHGDTIGELCCRSYVGNHCGFMGFSGCSSREYICQVNTGNHSNLHSDCYNYKSSV